MPAMHDHKMLKLFDKALLEHKVHDTLKLTNPYRNTVHYTQHRPTNRSESENCQAPYAPRKMDRTKTKKKTKNAQ